MAMWLWVSIGLGGFLALSVLVAFTVAAVLGAIGRQIGELHSELDEAEEWAMLPTARGADVTRAAGAGEGDVEARLEA
jgi:hypothetical protein